MKCYHVTTIKKLDRYRQLGWIKPPIRAWITINAAERFSLQTGRRIILRLDIETYEKLDGHRGEAIISNVPINVPEGIV